MVQWNGADGAQGPQGIQGIQGDQGPIGLTGPAGTNGTNGIDGVDGAQGPQGVQGDQGPIGLTGPAGADGADGADGAQGPQGIQGIQGDQGPIGLTGPAGTNGTNGIDGVDGAQGPQGVQGDQGPIGLTGPAGTNGTNGIDGVDGAQGPQGIQGDQGPIGLTGPSGTNGTNGIDGLDGVDGADGAQGLQGIQGDQGPIGLTGPAGADGVDGADGAQGPQGIQGDAGPSWTLTTPSFNTDGTMVVNGTSGSGGPVESSQAAWLLDGNTNTGTKGFGTNSNTNVDFETNSITRGRLLNTGEMLWGNTGILAPAIAGDPLQSYVVNNTNNWSFNGINTTAQGGGIFGSITSTANGFSGIEGSTNGTGIGVNGMHMSTTSFGVGVQGSTNNPVGAWAGIFMGDIGLTGGIFNISDVRFKKNIQPINSVIDKIMEVDVKQYNMRAEEFPGMSFNPNKTEIGFIAQDFKEIFPGLVHQKALPNPAMHNTTKKNNVLVEGYYTVNYVSMIPILTKAIQEQQNQISELQEQLNHSTDIDISGLIPSRIIASSNARLDSEVFFVANENSKAYVIGVLNDNNGIIEIQTSGIVEIEVDDANGQITTGDFVTTSSMGRAIKSLTSEWVLGVAVSNEVNGKVQVRIDIRFKQ